MARKLKTAVSQTPIKVEPISPLAAIEHAIQQFRGEIERFETRKEKFLSDAQKNLSYAIEWADGVLQQEYSASKLKNLLSAYDERKTGNVIEDLALLKKFVEHVRKENLRDLTRDYFRGASTSSSSNAVQHNHRAGASHLEDVFESISYYIADAEKGLQLTNVEK